MQNPLQDQVKRAQVTLEKQWMVGGGRRGGDGGIVIAVSWIVRSWGPGQGRSFFNEAGKTLMPLTAL